MTQVFRQVFAIGFAILCAAWASEDAPVLPEWLVPYPGTTATAQFSPGQTTETSYTTAASLNEVSAHYRQLFAAAGLLFTPNFDGLGYSIRASVAQGDLLLTIRGPSSGPTKVTLSYTVKRPGNAMPDPILTVTTVHTPTRVRLTPRLQEEHTRRVLEQADAEQRRRIAAMGQFDKPVPPERQKPFYNNDAPPLTWPSWLVAHGGRNASHPVAGVNQDGKKYLESRYTTSAPMSELYQFYLDLPKANGFRVGSSQLSTGHTLSGVMQNHTATIEAHRSEDGTAAGPSTRIKISLYRPHLNDPINVRLQVIVSGSFGR